MLRLYETIHKKDHFSEKSLIHHVVYEEVKMLLNLFKHSQKLGRLIFWLWNGFQQQTSCLFILAVFHAFYGICYIAMLYLWKLLWAFPPV